MSRPSGTCHICGKFGPLTFEHVPPKAAFNDQKVESISFERSLEVIPGGQRPRGRQQQKGSGGYTLCQSCNNFTGRMYVRSFAEFVYQANLLMERSGGRPTLAYPYHVFPLRVIKQIVSMFMSVNQPSFQSQHQSLVEFVLNPQRRYLPPYYGFYVHYIADFDGGLRSHGQVVGLNINDGVIRTFSEITFPPLGYIMTLGSPPPNGQLLDISHFARYGYDDFRMMQLKMPVFPTHLAIPGDYRSKDEILEHLARSREGTSDSEAA